MFQTIMFGIYVKFWGSICKYYCTTCLYCTWYIFIYTAPVCWVVSPKKKETWSRLLSCISLLSATLCPQNLSQKNHKHCSKWPSFGGFQCPRDGVGLIGYTKLWLSQKDGQKPTHPMPKRDQPKYILVILPFWGPKNGGGWFRWFSFSSDF